jgi:putative heme-binding domain-containing protein
LGREFVTDADRKQALQEIKEQATNQLKLRASARAEVIDRLLATTSSALFLAQALGDGRIPLALRPQVLAAVKTRPGSEISDLFERFIPDDQRVKRLGNTIRPEALLSVRGNAERGKELFFKSAGLQCINCHRVQGTGSTLGPDLSQIAKKYTKAQLLESILEPSKSIDPRYVNYVLETNTGQMHSGLIAKRDDQEIVLQAVGDKEIHVPTKSVQQLSPQKTSIMPEQLLRDLTAEQGADLLEYLSSLK